jgi:hypothetical protein
LAVWCRVLASHEKHEIVSEHRSSMPTATLELVGQSDGAAHATGAAVRPLAGFLRPRRPLRSMSSPTCAKIGYWHPI